MFFELTRGKQCSIDFVQQGICLYYDPAGVGMVYEKDETFITECGQDLSEDRLVARERRIVFFYQLQRLDHVEYSLQLSALYEGMRRRRDYSSG